METLEAKLIINGDASEGKDHIYSEKLIVTNIPHAWSMKREIPQPNEQAGVGEDRTSAVISWFHKNLGPKMIKADEIPLVVLQSVLGNKDEYTRRRLAQVLMTFLETEFKK